MVLVDLNVKYDINWYKITIFKGSRFYWASSFPMVAAETNLTTLVFLYCELYVKILLKNIYVYFRNCEHSCSCDMWVD